MKKLNYTGMHQAFFQLAHLLLFASLALPSFVIAQVPAFPCAEGFGAASVGGRGGRVIEVTNLNDNGPGSLRAALTATGPRTVVFRTGGTITLSSAIQVSGPNMSYLTIAGQTAPGGGIQIKGWGIWLNGGVHDVIIRYIKVRPGETGPNDWGVDKIGIQIEGTGGEIGDPVSPSYNIIIDHCDLNYSPRNNFGTWNYVHDITIQRSIIAYAIQSQNPSFGAKGANVGMTAVSSSLSAYNAAKISIHHNLWAHNHSRNPNIRTVGSVEVVNNVIYNFGAFGTEADNRDGNGGSTTQANRLNVIGNYYKAGANTFTNRYEVLINSSVNLPSLYVLDNIGAHRPSTTLPEWDIVGDIGPTVVNYATDPAPVSLRSTTPFVMSSYPITTQNHSSSLLTVFNNVLNDVGANKVNVSTSFKDALTQQAIDETTNGTGALILAVPATVTWPMLANGTAPTDTDQDGMPDTWETTNGLNPNNVADGAQFAVNGYTNLENYLNSMTSGSCSSLPISLPDVIIVPGSFSYACGVFTATIKNQGTAPTTGSSLDIGFFVNGVQVAYGSYITPLASGASVTINNTTLCEGSPAPAYCSGAYTIPIGTHTIMAFADPANRFTESNETNNTLSQTVTVTTPNNTVTTASSSPTLCINTALTSITHTTTGATGIGSATGLPTGVTAGWAANTITISGTPTTSGTFNYTIPLTGGCGTVSATGTITVTPNKTVTAASSTPTVCINTAITNITHTTTRATGIGSATGLPAGVTAGWAANTITISGTPTTSGTFNYTIPLTGGCGTVSATGTIVVNASTTNTDIKTACNSFTWIDGNTYTTNNNTATYTLNNATGCDSVITLNLTINTIDTSITQSVNTLKANQTGASYQWLDCNNSFAIISGATTQSYAASINGYYAVKITKNTCVDTSFCFNVLVTGVNEISGSEIRVYPNPFNNQFYIELANYSEDTKITISNVEGKIVYSNNTIQSKKIVLNATDWAKGVYIIKITNKQKNLISKLVKQ